MLRIGLLLPLSILGAGVAALGQYRADAAGAPPTEVAPAILQVLDKNGFKISQGDETYCEIWFRSNPPAAQGAAGRNVTLSVIPQGTLVGVIRFPGNGSDRRGLTIPAGVYTLRYAIMPMNGDHEGAAPHRDFLLLAPASSDREPAAIANLDALINLSKKVSGTRHPAVLSAWKAPDDAPGFSQQGDDWILQTKFGDTPIVVILIGTASS